MLIYFLYGPTRDVFYNFLLNLFSGNTINIFSILIMFEHFNLLVNSIFLNDEIISRYYDK
jgi:hypothetical protein